MMRFTNARIARTLACTASSARVLVAVALAGALSAACGGDDGVSAGALTTITVSPSISMVALSTQQMVAVGRDANGTVVTIHPVWSVAASGGTITTGGMFSAGSATGVFSHTVVATVGAVSGNATITVTSGVLATITVTPTPVAMQTSATQQFTAVGRDAGGSVVATTPVWSVANGGGTISAGGLFTANATAGTYANTIHATSGAITGLASVTTSVTAPPPPTSPLQSAADYGVLAGAGLSCATSGSVTAATGTANIGSSPTLTITGFPTPCTFSGSIPLPALVATAKGDLTTAYNAKKGQVCDQDLSGIDLGFYDGSTATKTLATGTYCFSTSAAITGTLKLTGSATAVWTFQIGSTFDANVGSAMILAGGALANNVYWAVGSSATLKTSSHVAGNILAAASITMQANTVLNGRALAQTGAVTMTSGGASIIKP